jgi:hypothetical protein
MKVLLSVGVFASVILLGSCNSEELGLVPRPSNSKDFSSKIFSVVADDIGNKQIYPPSKRGFDRWTYLLSKTADDLFSIPVRGLDSAERSTVFGFAAPVVNSGQGSGKEGCPEKPIQFSGYHWVKVWLFRAVLPEGSSKPFDFVQVVTPLNIHSSGIGYGSSTNFSYKPYRFKRDQDCRSADPDNAATGDCLATQTLQYEFHSQSTDELGNTTSNPFCALQLDRE